MPACLPSSRSFFFCSILWIYQFECTKRILHWLSSMCASCICFSHTLTHTHTNRKTYPALHVVTMTDQPNEWDSLPGKIAYSFVFASFFFSSALACRVHCSIVVMHFMSCHAWAMCSLFNAFRAIQTFLRIRFIRVYLFYSVIVAI